MVELGSYWDAADPDLIGESDRGDPDPSTYTHALYAASSLSSSSSLTDMHDPGPFTPGSISTDLSPLPGAFIGRSFPQCAEAYTAPYSTDLSIKYTMAAVPGYFRHTTYAGLTTFMDGMFNSRDKLARIGVVVTISGIPLGNTDVILNGLNHREIVRTDRRGVWWKYLEVDDYPDALYISPNGIVYDLLRQKERADNEGIFDQMVQRRTLANATSRLLHRKFV